MAREGWGNRLTGITGTFWTWTIAAGQNLDVRPGPTEPPMAQFCRPPDSMIAAVEARILEPTGLDARHLAGAPRPQIVDLDDLLDLRDIDVGVEPGGLLMSTILRQAGRSSLRGVLTADDDEERLVVINAAAERVRHGSSPQAVSAGGGEAAHFEVAAAYVSELRRRVRLASKALNDLKSGAGDAAVSARGAKLLVEADRGLAVVGELAAFATETDPPPLAWIEFLARLAPAVYMELAAASPSDLGLQLLAAGSIAERRRRDCFGALADLAESSDWSSRVMAATAMAGLGHPDARHTFARLARDTDAVVRATALDRLARTTATDAPEVLAAALSDGDPTVRLSATRAFERRPMWARRAELLHALDDDDPEVAASACRAVLGRHGGPPEDVVLAALQDQDSATVLSAVSAATSARTLAAEPVLIELYATQPDLAKPIAAALAAVWSTSPRRATDALFGDYPPPLQAAAAQGLAAAPPCESVLPLIAAAETSTVATAARRALNTVARREPRAFLLAFLDQVPDSQRLRRVQLLAEIVPSTHDFVAAMVAAVRHGRLSVQEARLGAKRLANRPIAPAIIDAAQDTNPEVRSFAGAVASAMPKRPKRRGKRGRKKAK